MLGLQILAARLRGFRIWGEGVTVFKHHSLSLAVVQNYGAYIQNQTPRLPSFSTGSL